MTLTTEGLRAYSYTRVSKVGSRGDDLISPELQAHSITEWAKRNGVTIVDQIQDLDESGRAFEKRKVKEMVAGIEAGEADMVVLWKWSRWGRNLLQSRIYIAAVEAAGGQVRASEEDFDPSTTMGKFTRDQMLMIAELQSNQIADGWKETHARRRRLGLPHTSLPRYGYDYVKESGYQINDVEARVLRELYRRVLEGETMGSLVRWANNGGHFTKRGERWTTSSLGRTLDTGFAAGLIRERSNPPDAATSGGKKKLADFDVWRDGSHEAIIDEDTWMAFKKGRLASASKPRRMLGSKHTFAGLLLCRECGSPMYSIYSGRHKKHTWTCGARQIARSKGLPTHAPVSCSDKRIETAVLAWVEEHRHGGEDMDLRVARAAAEARDLVPVSNVDNLAFRVTELKDQRLVLTRQLMRGRIAEEDFDVLTESIENELLYAEAAHAAAQVAAPARRQPTRAAWVAFDKMWDQADSEDRRRLLSTVISAVAVGPGPLGDSKLLVVPAWL